MVDVRVIEEIVRNIITENGIEKGIILPDNASMSWEGYILGKDESNTDVNGSYPVPDNNDCIFSYNAYGVDLQAYNIHNIIVVMDQNQIKIYYVIVDTFSDKHTFKLEPPIEV